MSLLQTHRILWEEVIIRPAVLKLYSMKCQGLITPSGKDHQVHSVFVLLSVTGRGQGLWVWLAAVLSDSQVGRVGETEIRSGRIWLGSRRFKNWVSYIFVSEQEGWSELDGIDKKE